MVPSNAPAVPIRVILKNFFVFYSSARKMSQKKNILVNVIPWTEDVEEIRSVRVQIQKNLAINIISLSFANFIGCRIQTEKNYHGISKK